MNLGTLRSAIREEKKVVLQYGDATGTVTDRTIWPLVLIYYVDTAIVVGWCELRQGLRHFRLDRVQDWSLSEDHFTGKSAALLIEWEKTQKDDTVLTRSF
jgi:predicted DNA-binding transcriptional regulator YafY